MLKIERALCRSLMTEDGDLRQYRGGSPEVGWRPAGDDWSLNVGCDDGLAWYYGGVVVEGLVTVVDCGEERCHRFDDAGGKPSSQLLVGCYESVVDSVGFAERC